MMFKYLPVVLATAILSACGGGGGGSSGGGNIPTPSAVITNTETSLSITGDNQIQTFNKTTASNLTITGSGNMVLVKSNIDILSITGDQNKIDLEAGIKINRCLLTGDNNTLTKVSSEAVKCTIAGKSNTGFN